MKSIYKYLLIAICSVSLVSCGDLDINENPNFPEEAKATPERLIPSGIAWSAARLSSDVQLVTSLWMQHYAQNNASNQYTNYDSYNIQNTHFAGVWSSMYSGALPDLYMARDKSEASSEWGYWIPAQVMIAFDYHILVDLYEKVPFTQAVKSDEYPAPVYDDGKAVNAGIISILDAVIAKENEALQSGKTLGASDFVFKGDVKKWVEFAKTLKLKILLRDFENNKVAIQAMLNAGGFLTEDARMNEFQDKENNSNPLYENDRRKLNTPNNLRASATMMTFLLENVDPRINAFYEQPLTNDKPAVLLPHLGLPQGGYTIEQGVIASSSTSRAMLAAEDPVYFMSVAESHFLQAECYARLGEKVKAKTAYEAGVTEAFARWGFDSDVASFLTGVYQFDDANTETMIKSIITQKWVASVRCQAWDAFFDFNRTGYPILGKEYTTLEESKWVDKDPNYVVGTLTPSLNSVLATGSFPKRFLITKNSSDNNANAPAVIPLATKMWWHK